MSYRWPQNEDGEHQIGPIDALHFLRCFFILLAIIFSGLSFYGLCVFGYECLLWLRDGYYTHISIGDLLPPQAIISLDWEGRRGLEKIWLGLLSEPVAFWAVFIGACLSVPAFFASIKIADKINARKPSR